MKYSKDINAFKVHLYALSIELGMIAAPRELQAINLIKDHVFSSTYDHELDYSNLSNQLEEIYRSYKLKQYVIELRSLTLMNGMLDNNIQLNNRCSLSGLISNKSRNPYNLPFVSEGALQLWGKHYPNKDLNLKTIVEIKKISNHNFTVSHVFGEDLLEKYFNIICKETLDYKNMIKAYKSKEDERSVLNRVFDGFMFNFQHYINVSVDNVLSKRTGVIITKEEDEKLKTKDKTHILQKLGRSFNINDPFSMSDEAVVKLIEQQLKNPFARYRSAGIKIFDIRNNQISSVTAKTDLTHLINVLKIQRATYNWKARKEDWIFNGKLASV